jgi:hypothetical protein
VRQLQNGGLTFERESEVLHFPDGLVVLVEDLVLPVVLLNVLADERVVDDCRLDCFGVLLDLAFALEFVLDLLVHTVLNLSKLLIIQT